MTASDAPESAQIGAEVRPIVGFLGPQASYSHQVGCCSMLLCIILSWMSALTPSPCLYDGFGAVSVTARA